jgi:hypothetical protein
MKCNKCGYDWGDSGDSAHVCGVVAIKKQWVGLSPNDLIHMPYDHRFESDALRDAYRQGVLDAEAKLKEKNT